MHTVLTIPSWGCLPAPTEHPAEPRPFPSMGIVGPGSIGPDRDMASHTQTWPLGCTKAWFCARGDAGLLWPSPWPCLAALQSPSL